MNYDDETVAWHGQVARSRGSPRKKRRAVQEDGQNAREALRSRRSRKPDWKATATANRQIIVLGMHRSGTSALTGALAQMGIYVGAEEDLTAKSWENPAGFFERRDARKICDTLLQGSGADWWKVSAFSVDNANYEAVRSQREAIRDLVRRLDEHGTWALKEPRLCFLLPFFQSALRNPLAIITIRHPIEVAKSLRRRNGFPVRAGLALWEAYTVRCCKSVRKSIAFLWISTR